jgi:hypothetical protein
MLEALRTSLVCALVVVLASASTGCYPARVPQHQELSPDAGGGGGRPGSDAGLGGGGLGGDGGAGGLPGPPPQNPIISAGRSRREAETSIAADGNGKVVAAWIADFGTSFTNGYSFSLDYGSTWPMQTLQIDSPNGRTSSDPVLAVDSRGNFYLSWVGYFQNNQGDTRDMHIYVARMPAGATSFTAPTEVSGTPPNNQASLDKPWIMIDAADTLYVTWTNLSDQNFNLARSTNGGTTWMRTVFSQEPGNLASPCVDTTRPGGPIYVVYDGVDNSNTQPVRIVRSTDGGRNWTQPQTIITGAVYQDPSCITRANAVWVSVALGASNPNNAHMTYPADTVVVARSSDNGQTWMPVGVSEGQQGIQYLLPQLTMSQSGKLVITYYQGAQGRAAVLRGAVSLDAGSTWGYADLAPTGFFTGDRDGTAWLGDYTGLYAVGDLIYVSYTNNSAQCPGSRDACAHIGMTRFMTP